MFTLLRQLTLCTILAAPLLSFAESNNLTVEDLDKPIVVQPGQTTIHLPIKTNRTTGYKWYLESYDSNFIHPVSSSYEAASSNLIGAPGVTNWKFKVLETAFCVPTVTKITLRHARTWDKDHGEKKVIWIFTDTTSK